MDAMAQFQEGHTHLALVSAHPAALRRTIRAGLPPEPGSEALGILTVEDILEVMLQTRRTRRTAPPARRPPPPCA
jgi:CBS domain containing-hemolysin-like protein